MVFETVVHSTDISTAFSECTDGDVRLMGGHTSSEGRVEVCINNAFGTVCDHAFSSQEAQVVCSQVLGMDIDES